MRESAISLRILLSKSFFALPEVGAGVWRIKVTCRYCTVAGAAGLLGWLPVAEPHPPGLLEHVAAHRLVKAERAGKLLLINGVQTPAKGVQICSAVDSRRKEGHRSVAGSVHACGHV